MKKALLLLLSTVFICTVVFAQKPEEKKQAEPKYTEIKYEADTYSYKWAGDNRILTLSGHVKFMHGDTVMEADKIDYMEETKTADASGNLRIHDERNVVTGDKCSIDFNKKKVVIEGGVNVLAKPKPKTEAKDEKKSIKSEIKDEINMACSKLEYFYKDKKGTAFGPLTITQKDRVITADKAEYTDELLRIIGNVKANDNKDKHSLTASQMTISLKDDNEWVEAEKASGTFYIKEEEEKPAEKPAETAPEKPAETPAETTPAP